MRVTARESEGEYMRTRDVVTIEQGAMGPRIRMVDKTTVPFKLRSGKWVAAGAVEMKLEGDQHMAERVVVFGSHRTTVCLSPYFSSFYVFSILAYESSECFDTTGTPLYQRVYLIRYLSLRTGHCRRYLA